MTTTRPTTPETATSATATPGTPTPGTATPGTATSGTATLQKANAPDAHEPPAARRAGRTRTQARFSPRTRKTILLLHVITSMTWLGLDIGLLMLSVTGYLSDDPVTLRAAYLSMNMIGDTLLIPVSLLALATGVALSLGTRWGLVRYRWVLTKLVITLITATLTIFSLRDGLHEAAAGVMENPPSPGEAGVSLLFAPVVSLTCYLFMTVLSVFKPWGRTRWGRRATASPS